ncbi:MAG: hypothetical protein AB7G13_12230 [Lautropia sp.]
MQTSRLEMQLRAARAITSGATSGPQRTLRAIDTAGGFAEHDLAGCRNALLFVVIHRLNSTASPAGTPAESMLVAET